MADMKQMMSQMQASFNELGRKINFALHFVENRLKNYKNITLQEQIAYPIIGLGLLLILVSFFFFIF